MSNRYLLAVVLLGTALWLEFGSTPEQKPEPPVPGAFTLYGCFRGEDAAEDAAIVSGLCSELADAIEWDGMQDVSVLSNGVDMDLLRVKSRELRCKGVSIGDKHPKVSDAVKSYLDEELGISGGPVSAEQRAKWVDAYRVIAKAAEDAIK